jgi:hypothetical protein
MKYKLADLLLLLWLFLLLNCSSPNGHSRKTVGSETTNAYIIITDNENSAGSAQLYWVEQLPEWYHSFLNGDSLWIIKASADSNGYLLVPPEISRNVNLFVHYEDQSILLTELPELGDTLQLKSSGNVKGEVINHGTMERVCVAGTWLCGIIDNSSGEYWIAGVPEGSYQLVGEYLDTSGVPQIILLGAVEIGSGDTVIHTKNVEKNVIPLLDFNSISDNKSPLSAALGFHSGYGYVVYEGDLEVTFPKEFDSDKPTYADFLQQDLGRNDLAFHIAVKTGPDFHYFHIGAEFDSSLTFRAADSIYFWSKGSCDAEIKFFENNKTNLAASYRFEPDTTWKRYSFATNNFSINNNLNPSDSLLNWQSIQKEFNHVVFASFGQCEELWVDDLGLSGVSIRDILR